MKVLVFSIVYILIAIIVASFIVSEGIFGDDDAYIIGFISIMFPLVVPLYAIGFIGGKLSEYIKNEMRSRRK